MKNCEWNVRSLYRAGSLMTVMKELSKYNLHLVTVQEALRDRDGTSPASQYTFSMEIRMRIMKQVQLILYIRKSYHK
jgi:hypothetical protein